MSPARLCASSDTPKTHPGFPQRNVTVGMETPWKLPVDVVLKILLGATTVADKLQNTVLPGVGFWFNRVAGETVSSLCMSQLNAVTMEISFRCGFGEFTRGDPSLENAVQPDCCVLDQSCRWRDCLLFCGRVALV